MSSTFKRDVTINLGAFSDSISDVTRKRQSILRSWRRLSSLQRLIIGIVLLSTVVIALFVLPSLMSNENRPEFDKVQPKKESESFEELHQIADVQKLDKNLEDLKKKDPVKQHIISTYDFFGGQQQTPRQKQVVEAFKHAWSAYKKYAWGKDELHPLSKTSSEWFGTGLTLVDSLDTLIIMGLKEEYDEAKAWVEDQLTFNVDKYVNLFEITIRNLGALLAAYHLTGHEVMKIKAIDLGERLLNAFNHNSKIPYSDVNLANGIARPPKWGPDSSTSEVTTIQLEFRDLSLITGNPRFADAVHEVSMHVHELPKTDGLVPIFINANSGDFRPAGTITLGARGDSYYEYLLKQWLQSGKKLKVFKEDFDESYRGVKKSLMRRSEPSKLLFIGELLSGRSFSPKMDHLVCFYPATLALAYHHGMGNEYLEDAKDLLNTCYEMYNRMPTKLSPEIVYFNLAQGVEEDLIVKPLDAHNLLRPETVESMFYLYRLTRNETYRDQAWQIFLAFEKHTKLPESGYSSINNVKDAGNPRFRDKMESFFLSETLKYLYLIFSDDFNLISLDDFVFNSEGHPLPIYNDSVNEK
ncbi:endoplasmic reticulum mannosyl-oligosaccharide 1,2-alpha-mannosidase-like isoform X2 [Physella acuta]|uniref:endoplasmic reticulum mannosyl-oligosaccharide 1,2-alpha-mannosidase-like isoform X2 n=1 Tax=Physella acuta TaxID=109671 RepID=UPI0027DBA9A7|nr:endoplasmic reticulum mannosyl-oligosaccharide 1,2-alpha-mannosidase-like isoform X2 [Physella acuta]